MLGVGDRGDHSRQGAPRRGDEPGRREHGAPPGRKNRSLGTGRAPPTHGFQSRDARQPQRRSAHPHRLSRRGPVHHRHADDGRPTHGRGHQLLRRDATPQRLGVRLVQGGDRHARPGSTHGHGAHHRCRDPAARGDRQRQRGVRPPAAGGGTPGGRTGQHQGRRACVGSGVRRQVRRDGPAPGGRTAHGRHGGQLERKPPPRGSRLDVAGLRAIPPQASACGGGGRKGRCSPYGLNEIQ